MRTVYGIVADMPMCLYETELPADVSVRMDGPLGALIESRSIRIYLQGYESVVEFIDFCDMLPEKDG